MTVMHPIIDVRKRPPGGWSRDPQPRLCQASPQRHHYVITASPLRHNSDRNPKPQRDPNTNTRKRKFNRPRADERRRADAPPRAAHRTAPQGAGGATAGRGGGGREAEGRTGRPRGGRGDRWAEKGEAPPSAAHRPPRAAHRPPLRGDDRRAVARAERGRPAIEEDHQQPDRPPFSPVHGRGGAKKTPVILYGGMGAERPSQAEKVHHLVNNGEHMVNSSELW